MQKNRTRTTRPAFSRKGAYQNLMDTRPEMMYNLFGDNAPTETILSRLNSLKGIKKFFYTFQYVIENQQDKEQYMKTFEDFMILWINDKLSSTFMENHATLLISKIILETK
jgi:hypothetical protein